MGCAVSSLLLGLSSGVVSRGCSLVVVHGLFIEVASLVAEHWLSGVQASVVSGHRLSSRDTLAWLLRGMWDLPGPEIEPVSPALPAWFLTTEPPGKPSSLLRACCSWCVGSFLLFRPQLKCDSFSYEDISLHVYIYVWFGVCFCRDTVETQWLDRQALEPDCLHWCSILYRICVVLSKCLNSSLPQYT